MPTLNPNSKFQTFNISPAEEAESKILNPSQRAWIQNQMVEAVEQKASLAPNDMSAASKESYWQQEAYLRGQIDIFNYLLATSDQVSSAANQPADPSQLNSSI